MILVSVLILLRCLRYSNKRVLNSSLIQDILDEYDLTLEQSEISFPQLSPEEESIYQIIVKNKPEAAFDTILIEAEMSISKLSTVLLNLELKSVIKKISGNKIVPLY
jgi:predicted Rossmann fold nucleotide-binding protein DprA/Smf involved in DNA uptake